MQNRSSEGYLYPEEAVILTWSHVQTHPRHTHPGPHPKPWPHSRAHTAAAEAMHAWEAPSHHPPLKSARKHPSATHTYEQSIKR